MIWDQEKQTVIVENEAYRQLQCKNAKLNESDAVSIASDAQNHFWQMSMGGSGDHINGSIVVKGKEYSYRWMSSTLDTKAKFIEYEELLYTPEQTQAYWKKLTDSGSIVEIDGKLAQPDADGGSALRWSESTAKLTQEDTGTKTFRFHVPLHEGSEEKVIKLRYVTEKGWRINEPVDSIR